MKAFTDLNQSKKLAEILPIESADMCWQYLAEDNGQLQWFCFPKDFSINQHDNIPCWSLAALLEVLPSATLDSSDDRHYRLYCDEKFTEWHDNPIDCCIAMIDRLHEQMIYDFNNSNN